MNKSSQDRDPAAEVQALIDRSRRLGSDPRVTNYAGGNTSVKVTETDPVTGEPVEVMWIKGSGGDLGTLERNGLAPLVLDRLIALQKTYPGEDREDEMVALFDYCSFGPGGAAPSIDTPLHGFLPPRHVDHVHPDSVIALAASEDGEALTKECYGDEVAWLPWKRPGFELALQLQQTYRDNPGLTGVVLGGHGLFAWGDTSEECEGKTMELIEKAEKFIAERGRAEPFGAVIEVNRALDPASRRSRAAELGPIVRGLASKDKLAVGHFKDDEAVLDFLSRTEAPRLVELGTSCPDHFLRTKVRPLLLDLPATSTLEESKARLIELHEAYRSSYSAYYDRFATPESPAMRGADPAIFLIPGVGMWSFGADAQTARVAGEFYINAINVIRGAEALSKYCPIDESEKFAIEYWLLEEAKLKRRPPARALAGRVALVTGAGSGIGRATAVRLAAEGAVIVATDLNLGSVQELVDELGGADKAAAAVVDVSDEKAVEAAVREACLRFGGVDLVVNNAGLSISASLLETTAEQWDLQHNVMARGSFLVSRAAAKVMIEQGVGGDIVYIVSKNALFAGPNNIAYGSAKADQAHQVRLLAAELGPHNIRINGVNPDAVVRGSGIFAKGWGAQRAAVYGVKEEDLGKFYAERSLLKQEVLPENIADAVFALVGGNLRLTTGTLIPVDGGVPGAFLR